MGTLRNWFGGTPEQRRQRFWEWFSSNAHRLPNAGENPSYEALVESAVLGELGAQLAKVQRGLVFELGRPEDGLRTLCISAEGIREYFPVVEALVAAAPAVPGWKIQAFRQPVGTDLELQFGELKLGADDIWYTADPQHERIELRLFLRGLEDGNRNAMLQGTFLLLDAALGEYDVATCIGAIEWEPLPVDPVRSRLQPFRSLPECVRRFRELRTARES